MRKTKLIPLLLALALLALAGCNRNAATAPAENTPSAPSAPAPESTLPAPAGEEEANVGPSAPASAPAENEAGSAPAADRAAYDEALSAYKYVIGHNEELEQFLSETAESGKVLTPSRFALLDLDGDALPEVVIELSDVYPYYYQVLRYEDGAVYEYMLFLRQFTDLKEDGTFSWSSSAAENGFGRLRFDGGEFTIENIAHISGGLDGEEFVVTYYIGGEPVTEEEYDAFATRQLEKPDAPWLDFTQENIDAVFSR